MEKLIIFDLDGTLIDSDHHIHDAFMKYLHENISPHVAGGLTFEQFLERNQNMHAMHGSSITGWQKELGFDENWTRGHFSGCAPLLAQQVIDNLRPDEVILTGLEAIRAAGIEIAVLTHSYDTYAAATMEHMDLFRIIKRQNVFGMDRIKCLKNEPGGPAYKLVLNELGAHKVASPIMVENTYANLPEAAKLNIRTALTNVPQPDDVSVVDFYHPTIHQALPELRLAA